MKKILIVEDEELLASILTNKLTALGYETVRAKDGAEGGDVAIETQPDLIITDVLLPTIDGVSMIKEIRKTLPTTPVIILTNLEKIENTAGIITPPRDMILKKTYYTLEKLVTIITEKLPLTT